MSSMLGELTDLFNWFDRIFIAISLFESNDHDY